MDAATHQTLGLRTPDDGEFRPARLSNKGSRTRRGKGRLLNRESLDGRSAIAKAYDALAEQIRADLGGAGRLSAIELSMVEAFAGASIALDSLNTRILTGAEITPAMAAMHASAASTMVRIASRLGIERRARIVPSLDEFLELRLRARGDKPKEEIIP
jgi:hypothetical protein